MRYVQFSGDLKRIERRRVKRPWGIIVVACFQLMKAGILLITGIMLHWKPEAVISSQCVLYPLLYVAMRVDSSVIDAVMQGGNLAPVLISLGGVSLGVLGLGLWQMKGWARLSVIFTSGITLLFFAKTTFFPSMTYFSPSPDLQNLHILLFLDVIALIYLLRGTTADCFRVTA